MLKIWEESSIHGVRYISDSKRNFIIRLFWLFSFSLSIFCLFYYGKEAFIKFNVKPDINLVINMKPIREIPFPAVTICSPEPVKNKFSFMDVLLEEDFLDYMRSDDFYHAIENDEMRYIAAYAQACNSNHISNLFQNQPDLLDVAKERNLSSDIMSILNEITFDTSRVFKKCESYHGYHYNCSRVMRKVITNHGFCYTYNLLDYDSIFNGGVISRDFDSYKGIVFSREVFKENSSTASQWTLANGYTTANDNVPFRIVNRHKFNVDMKFAFEYIYKCKVMNGNYKVIIHLPNEYPTQFHYYKYIESSNANRVLMTAEFYDTDPNLRKFSPEMRGCYFEGERKLKFFKTYTKSQCNLECLTNFTLKLCGCVKFSMPREESTPVCNLTQIVCYEEARSDWFDLNADNVCKCLQPCTYIFYDLEDEDRMYDGEARLEMSFDEFQIKSHKNFVSYQLPNLIAELGGLLGLFMGCSLLSIIELFYFCFATVAYAKRSREMPAVQRFVLPTYVTKLYVSELRRPRVNDFQREFVHKAHHI